LLVSCGSINNKKDSAGKSVMIQESKNGSPKLVFSKISYDFGKITEGEIVGTSFTFTNTGNSNLLILDASASCGCTVPKWSKEPVLPGGRGTLDVIFDSSGREGKQNKSISVRSNASDQDVVIFITAEVKSDK